VAKDLHDMSNTDTTRVTLKSGESAPRGDTDWTRLDAMTDQEVVAAALSDPDAQPLTAEQLAKMRRVRASRYCDGVSA
jgi:putative transcriptional regulator